MNRRKFVKFISIVPLGFLLSNAKEVEEPKEIKVKKDRFQKDLDRLDYCTKKMINNSMYGKYGYSYQNSFINDYGVIQCK